MVRIKFSWVKILAILVGSFIVLLTLTIAGVSYAHKNTFYPGVSIDGISLGGKTQEEGKSLLEEKTKSLLSHQVSVVIPDISKPLPDWPDKYEDMELRSSAEQVGLEFDSKTLLHNAWQVGHQTAKLGFSKTSKLAITYRIPAIRTMLFGYHQPLSYQIDSLNLQAFIDTEVIPKIGTPTPATIIVKDEVVSIEPEKSGFSTDKEKLVQQLAVALKNTADSDLIYVHAPVELAQSPVTAENLQPIATQLDALGSTKISLVASGITSIYPKKATILGWFSPVLDENNRVSLNVNQDAVTEYLKTQKGLDYGKSLKNVVQKLVTLAAIDNPKASAITVIAKPVAASRLADVYTAGRYAGKYVEINLAQQKMYLVNGETLDKSYVVSSGKWSTPTPKGDFKIQGKIARAYSKSFGLYMPYWQNFLNGEYGIHELPEWPNGYKEGANHIGTPVSHGCVRLGVGAAKEVYGWTEIGTPVYIH